MRAWLSWLAAACLVVGVAAWADERQDQERLAKLQSYVGRWQGVGQPKRGSSRGAWRENLDWAWKFAGGTASLTVDIKEAKFFDSGQLLPAGDGEGFELVTRSADNETRYRGTIDADGVLVLTAAEVAAGQPARIQIRQVAEGQRMLILYEQRTGSDRFLRLAEVGYTREGSDFGKGVNFVECVVTGGLGTIPVSYDGKTYYVCCTGCRDYFKEAPEEVLADYHSRRKQTGRTVEDGK